VTGPSSRRTRSSTTARHLLRQRTFLEGVLVADTGAQTTDSPVAADVRELLLNGSKNLLATGAVAFGERERLRGHDVTWLRFPPWATGYAAVAIAVDWGSDRPLALRLVCPSCSMQSPVARILTAENVTRSPTTFTAAARAPAPGRGQHSPQEYTGSHQVAITPAAAATAFGHHAL
jgi:hypothetical protein